MLIIYSITFIATAFLIIYGNLSFWIGIPLLVVSAGSIAFLVGKFTKSNIAASQLKRKTKAKWIGELTLIEGFDLVPNQTIFMILTRKDSLLFISEQKDLEVSLEDIDGILLAKGKSLLNLSDNAIKNYLNRTSDASVFNNIRNLLKTNGYYAKKYVLLFSLNYKYNQTNNIRRNQDLVTLILMQGKANFKHLLKRPEFSRRLRIYNKKIRESSQQPGIRTAPRLHDPKY